MATQAERVITKFQQLKSQRANWDHHWQEVADFCLPRKNQVFDFGTFGEKRGAALFDGTALHAVETLASALHGMLTNAALFWFELTSGIPEIDADDDVRFWLQDTSIRIHNTLNATNFQTEIHELYIDLVTFGTAVMNISEDPDRLITFKAWPIYDNYIAENNVGIVDTIYRNFHWTARQIVDEFGEEALKGDPLDTLKNQLEKDPNLRMELLHCIEPNTTSTRNNIIKASDFPFSSVYILMKNKQVISEGGFREFPTVVSRWTKTANEHYGRSPAMKALPDIKMINEVMKSTIKSAQKQVDPPLQMVDDALNLPIKLNPGGLNYRRAGTDKIEPIVTGGRVDFGFQFIENLKGQIREAFFIDQLQLVEGPQMTATEVQQRVEEKLRLLGPLLARQQFELLRPMIDRVFGIMLRRNQFLPIPDKLSNLPGGELSVRYTSQIAKAQRLSETQNFNRAMALIGPIAQADPSVLDNIDGDATTRGILKRFGIPEEMIRTKVEVDQLRQQRAEAQAEAEELAKAQAQSEQIRNAGPTVLKAIEGGAA